MFRNLSRGFVEHAHDVLVETYLPFDEQTGSGDYRDANLIDSALGRPFQTAFGQEVWPSLAQKAAAIFHSLACNHCFLNGNKRTAVFALDAFLSINGRILTLSWQEIYHLAKYAVEANSTGLYLDVLMDELASRIDNATLDVRLLEEPAWRQMLQTSKPHLLERLDSLKKCNQELADVMHLFQAS